MWILMTDLALRDCLAWMKSRPFLSNFYHHHWSEDNLLQWWRIRTSSSCWSDLVLGVAVIGIMFFFCFLNVCGRNLNKEKRTFLSFRLRMINVLVSLKEEIHVSVTSLSVSVRCFTNVVGEGMSCGCCFTSTWNV